LPVFAYHLRIAAHGGRCLCASSRVSITISDGCSRCYDDRSTAAALLDDGAFVLAPRLLAPSPSWLRPCRDRSSRFFEDLSAAVVQTPTVKAFYVPFKVSPEQVVPPNVPLWYVRSTSLIEIVE
jgi:hypothetical protein